MRNHLAAITVLIFLSGQPSRAQYAFGGLQLLNGYSAKRAAAVDAAAWTIEGKRGLTINFEAGPNEGSWADPQDRGKYVWYREQTIHGLRVRFGLVKPGLKTQWEPGDSRGLPPGNILLVTYLLDGEKSSHTANFSAKIANQDEFADVLLMVTTFDPSKGKF
jgi:hypothetical protein